MKIGIVIATYQRSDGLTSKYLYRALQSISNQTYTNYEIIVVGDHYENADEFKTICKSIDFSDRIHFENLPYALERNKYQSNPRALWCTGGVNARNHGIKLALERGLSYICHLDHDDYWETDHLARIANVIKTDPNSVFICTCATYYDKYLPYVKLNETVIQHIPSSGNIIHSSVCINHKLIPLLYRDVYEEEFRLEPADADMWTRLASFLSKNNLSNHSYLITKLTCYHPTENQ
jgi:glycosyltransferase involved in cell wall biosynthesis